MFRRLQHIIIWAMIFFSYTQVTAQVAMPDTVCVGMNRIYKVNDASRASSYTWKIDGVIQATIKNEMNITWNVPGEFLITVQEHANGGCDGDIMSGKVFVSAPPLANAGPDAVLCFGNTFRLNGSGGNFYQWSPPSYLSNATIANPVATIPFAGTYKYSLRVSNAFGCKSVNSDTVSITILPQAKIFAGNDTSITLNQPLQLNAVDVNNSGFVNYSWSPSFGLNNVFIKNPIALLDKSITYTVTARTDAGCEASDDIKIAVFLKPELYVPTGFTPNGDGLNDFAVVIPVGMKELKYFSIFNRGGELVFKTSNAAIGWNGIYKGRPQNGDVFVWSAAGVDYNGNTIYRKGTVVLIR
jgi:gliding motility-associated-like protein